MNKTIRLNRLCALFFLALAAATLSAQAPCPPKPGIKDGVKQIENDPRFTKLKFRVGILPANALKKDLTPAMIRSLNYLYGWDLPDNKECFDVEQNGHLIYEIVISPNYNKDVFLQSLEKAEALLRQTRQKGTVAQFNQQHGANIPPTGPLGNLEAERLIYQIVGKANFSTDIEPKLVRPGAPTDGQTAEPAFAPAPGATPGQTPPPPPANAPKPAAKGGWTNTHTALAAAAAVLLIFIVWYRRKRAETAR